MSSWGEPSQWKRRIEVDTTVPENPIQEQLEELNTKVEELNKSVSGQVGTLAQSVVDQTRKLRQTYQGRLEFRVKEGMLTPEQIVELKSLGVKIEIWKDVSAWQSSFEKFFRDKKIKF